jgi:2'-5' RNA ligase
MKRRVFVSINPPQEIKEKVSSFVKKLSLKYKEISWVDPNDFHITLFFLGSADENKIAKVTAISKLLLKNHKIFSARFNSPEIFPTFNLAKLIWLRSSGSFDLVNLQQRIVSQLKLNGIIFEEQPFIPHATLGRVKKNIKNPEQLVKDLSVINLDGFLISHIDVMESTPNKKGSSYKTLFRIPLENSIVSKNIFV